MEVDFDQIIVQILGFLLMLWVLKKFGWKPILDHLEERRQRIKSELEFAEAQRKEATELVAEYQKKLNDIGDVERERIKQAIAEGQTIALEIQTKAQESIKEAQLKIQSNIHMEITKAEGRLKDQLVQTVVVTTEKLLDKTLKADEDHKLIEDFIEEVKF